MDRRAETAKSSKQTPTSRKIQFSCSLVWMEQGMSSRTNLARTQNRFVNSLARAGHLQRLYMLVLQEGLPKDLQELAQHNTEKLKYTIIAIEVRTRMKSEDELEVF